MGKKDRGTKRRRERGRVAVPVLGYSSREQADTLKGTFSLSFHARCYKTE